MHILPKRLSTKIPVIMIASVSLLVATLVFLSAWMGGKTSISLTETALRNAAEGRTSTVTLYMNQLNAKMRDMASHTVMVDAATELFGGWNVLKSDAPDILRATFIEKNPNTEDERYKLLRSSEDTKIYYEKVHAKHQERIQALLSSGLFRDVLMVGKSGDIFYSYRKGGEFGRNFATDDVLNPELQVQIEPLIKAANDNPKDPVSIQGFTGFVNVDGRVSAYMVTPILKWNKIIGAVAFEVETGKLAEIVANRSGLGETGKLQVISANLEEIDLARNTISSLEGSQLDIATSALKGSVASGDVAVHGEDYRAIAVPMSVMGTSWAVVALQSYDELMAPANALTRNLLIAGSLLLVILGGFGAYFVRRAIAPLQTLNNGVMEIAKENYSVNLPDHEREDEIGELSRSVAVLRNSALERQRLEEQGKVQQKQQIERQVAVEAMIERFRVASSGLLDHVSDNMDRMKGTAQLLSTIAETTADKANTSAHASEEASSNVQTVATAAEELSSSIEEIKRQVGETSGVVEQATEATQRTTETISGLSSSAQKVGDVVSLIKAIAEQTNLLALNATIEAARAGEHGRGFAVVAAEVKELATQTSNATEDIASQIQNIQGATQLAVQAIQDITETMDRVNEYTHTISHAVNEQGVATFEISHNVAQAASGTKAVAGNMAELSASVAETTQSVAQVDQSSQDVANQTMQLREEVDDFLKSVANA
ncbi:Methyl-accepting chemotaxis protein [Cohaesibacter sp. ES.047]|uniref:methyl-accepting chemotaxis protein n=1 Tax=Cohaesibacter sp. ES.047 TaxID=1798205 RepID=UPI000BB7063E|nr:methyl-accepting chemotaxis protein [Cohaesibacter sp. ES.047]SNY92833.1 Methyl-accepting chemotaxis protein [Cohaesibacter sp. ES.047]